MRYPGGKGKTFQHVINLMPPHRVYIETHLGGGAVLRHKRPATISIAIDRDPKVIEAWSCEKMLGLEVHCTRAEDFLRLYEFRGDELLYVDPPYYPSTRKRKRVYRFEYVEHDHEELLRLLRGLPCQVIVSGYANELYSQQLGHWHTRTFQAKTHTDTRVETLWFNFEPPTVLHDSRYLGENFREREQSRRRMERLRARVRRLDPRERAAFAQWLHRAYPAKGGEALP
jgi:DNA adenine methylase